MVEILVEEERNYRIGKPIARIVTDVGMVSESITANPTTDSEPAPTPIETIDAATAKASNPESQTIGSANTHRKVMWKQLMWLCPKWENPLWKQPL